MRDPKGTRQRFLNAASEEIFRAGFQGANIDQILTSAGMSRGALYHHFPSKTDLGYAVVEEVLGEVAREVWVEPLKRPGDPISQLQRILRKIVKNKTTTDVALGCPLNNLIQEMASRDTGFRRRLQSLLDLWVNSVADALQRGVEEGFVLDTISPHVTARFIVASQEGINALGQATANKKSYASDIVTLIDYLEGLRAPVAAAV